MTAHLYVMNHSIKYLHSFLVIALVLIRAAGFASFMMGFESAHTTHT